MLLYGSLELYLMAGAGAERMTFTKVLIAACASFGASSDIGGRRSDRIAYCVGDVDKHFVS